MKSRKMLKFWAVVVVLLAAEYVGWMLVVGVLAGGAR